jgi:hypothetical protein
MTFSLALRPRLLAESKAGRGVTRLGRVGATEARLVGAKEKVRVAGAKEARVAGAKKQVRVAGAKGQVRVAGAKVQAR